MVTSSDARNFVLTPRSAAAGRVQRQKRSGTRGGSATCPGSDRARSGRAGVVHGRRTPWYTHESPDTRSTPANSHPRALRAAKPQESGRAQSRHSRRQAELWRPRGDLGPDTPEIGPTTVSVGADEPEVRRPAVVFSKQCQHAGFVSSRGESLHHRGRSSRLAGQPTCRTRSTRARPWRC